MAKPRRFSGARESRRSWWLIAGLIAFVVVDVLLVVLALRSTAPSPTKDGTPESLPLGPTTSAPSPRDTADPEDRIVAVAPTRLLAALDASTAWRATTGACPDAEAEPELTTDGGASWKTTDITGATDVRALQRMIVSSAETASFIGLTGGDCTPQYVRTFVAGDDFAEYPDQLATSWYVAPAGASTTHTPAGDADAPCPSAVALAPLTVERAAVLCADTSLHVTDDTGSTWSPLTEAIGAIALTETADGYLVAAAGRDDCEGVQLSIVDATGSRSDIGCVESPLPAAELAASIAIDWTPESVWLWLDERLLISTDGGTTW